MTVFDRLKQWKGCRHVGFFALMKNYDTFLGKFSESKATLHILFFVGMEPGVGSHNQSHVRNGEGWV